AKSTEKEAIEERMKQQEIRFKKEKRELEADFKLKLRAFGKAESKASKMLRNISASQDNTDEEVRERIKTEKEHKLRVATLEQDYKDQ
ncbi:unnamed protein product, partial [Amoebophrya sp. A25]